MLRLAWNWVDSHKRGNCSAFPYGVPLYKCHSRQVVHPRFGQAGDSAGEYLSRARFGHVSRIPWRQVRLRRLPYFRCA